MQVVFKKHTHTHKVYHGVSSSPADQKAEVTADPPLLFPPFTPVCVLVSRHCLLPSCLPRFVWTAIKNQPIGTAGRRARASPEQGLARAGESCHSHPG